MRLIERIRERAQRHAVETLSDYARQHNRTDVADQIDHAVSQPRTTLPWLQIIAALLPFITTMMSGGTLNFDGLLQAILGLLQSKGIAPA
jgi:hypothetical protein